MHVSTNHFYFIPYPAVREDRSPGGKHRHKRPKIEDTQHLATVSSSTSPVVKAVEIKLPMEKSAVDDPLRESLLAAKPHLYPKAESKFLLNFPNAGSHTHTNTNKTQASVMVDW